MGAGNSTPSADGQHVFTADGPVRFSQSVVESLQNSPETDSTRSRNLELQVQTRVKAELEKIRDLEASRLHALTERLTSASSSDDAGPPQPAQQQETDGTSSQPKDRARVAREVDALKAKLDRRKRLEKADDGVEGARHGLVACLTANEKRPLDCWAEVEKFKGEVARYEARFLDKTLRP